MKKTCLTLVWPLLLCACSVKMFTQSEDLLTADSLKGFLAHHQISSEGLVVLDPEASGMYSVFPRVWVLDSKGRLLYEKAGYSEDITRKIDQRLAKYKAVESEDPSELPLLRSPEGDRVDLDDLPSARFYILEFWTTWCLPCPILMKELKEYVDKRPEGDQDIALILVNCDIFKFPASRLEGDGEQEEQPEPEAAPEPEG